MLERRRSAGRAPASRATFGAHWPAASTTISARTSPFGVVERPGAVAALERRHRRVPEDRGRARAADERARQARSGRRARRVGRYAAASTPSASTSGCSSRDALRPDDLDRDAEQLGDRRRDDGTRRRGPASSPAGRCRTGGSRRLAGPLERLVELDAVAQQAHQVVARVELRAEPGRVPGRAARQLVLLEQHDVLQPSASEVVEQAAAGDAAPDDRDPGFREHVWMILSSISACVATSASGSAPIRTCRSRRSSSAGSTSSSSASTASGTATTSNQPSRPDGPYFEGWTLLAALAARTERIRVGVLVSSNTFRHPALLAQQAVTLDHVSNGRLELGLGAGWFVPEHERFGIPFPPPGERVGRFREAVQILDSLLRRRDDDLRRALLPTRRGVRPARHRSRSRARR